MPVSMDLLLLQPYPRRLCTRLLQEISHTVIVHGTQVGHARNLGQLARCLRFGDGSFCVPAYRFRRPAASTPPALSLQAHTPAAYWPAPRSHRLPLIEPHAVVPKQLRRVFEVNTARHEPGTVIRHQEHIRRAARMTNQVRRPHVPEQLTPGLPHHHLDRNSILRKRHNPLTERIKRLVPTRPVPGHCVCNIAWGHEAATSGAVNPTSTPSYAVVFHSAYATASISRVRQTCDRAGRRCGRGQGNSQRSPRARRVC
jgi:hypothetical protein